MSKMSDQPWGFWVILRNKADALWALKMSGLLFFLMGGSCLLLFARLVAQGQADTITLIILAILATFLIWSGIRIRNKKFGTFILSTVLYLGAQIIHFLTAPIGLILFAVLHCILMLSALRAWFFLRKAPFKEQQT